MTPAPRNVLFWLLVGLLLFGAWLVTHSSECYPPVPTTRPTHKKAVAVTQGAGAAALIAKPAVVPPIARTNLTLAWDWTATADNPQSNVVFVVRQCKTNRLARPELNWPVVATVTSNRATVPIDKTARTVWLTVTASNRVTGMESDFAR